jgi:hypothetical protein
MTIGLLGTLFVLALVDSTSFGTLLIPIWLMLNPGRLQAIRIVVFLGTVAAFYLVLGLLLTAGVNTFSEQIAEAIDTFPVQLVQGGLGIALVIAAFRIGRAKDSGGPGRLLQWRERAVADGSFRALMGLAVLAALVESASMVPYIAAIGLIGTANISWVLVPVVLGGYCVVMVLPALLLLVGRVFVAGPVEPVLHRVNDWMVRTGREDTAWIVGIIGFVLAVTALDGLGVLDAIDSASKS